MRASSYSRLPKELKAKRGSLHIQNNDKKYFLWSILARLHPVQHRNSQHRVWKYQEYELNMSRIKYPVDLKDISRVEHQNNVSVNVYGNKDENLPVTYYHHDHCKSSRKFIIYHYWWNITLCIGKRLEQTGLNPMQQSQQQTLFLSILFTWLYQWRGTEKPFGKMQVTRSTTNQDPEADDKKGHDKVTFTKTEYQLRLPFIIYAHFESVLHIQGSCEPSSSKSFTTQYQHHVPWGSYIYWKCIDGRYFEPPKVNIRDDATENFWIRS